MARRSSRKKKRAYDYFSGLYRDTTRGEKVTALAGMKRPQAPTHLLSEEAPSLKEILASRRNKAAPGLDGINYVPYKRCQAILPILVQLFAKVWRSKQIPDEWAAASIQLLSKSSVMTEPSEFRPIALTNSISKIFFAIIAKRLDKFLESNKFLSTAQKGFKASSPGCLEHSFSMFEALLDAKHNQRQIVVSWLDLKNAYGSVRHNRIQFALEWYHVPLLIRELIFDYYDRICAQIRVNEFRTKFFVFDIGLFQGCVLSCILFNCVFQLLLDLIKPLSENGYHFKDIAVVLHDQAFADDISITTATPELNQRTINAVVEFLHWYHLQANPKKCICMGMKRHDPDAAIQYNAYGDTVYCPYDPELTIDGERLKFIVTTAADPTSLQFDHFKELGRFISVDLKEDKVKAEMRRRVIWI